MNGLPVSKRPDVMPTSASGMMSHMSTVERIELNRHTQMNAMMATK